MNLKQIRQTLQHQGVYSSPSKSQITYLSKDVHPIVNTMLKAEQVDTILFDMDGVAADWRTAARPFAESYLGVGDTEGQNFDWLNKHELCDPCCRAMYSSNPRMFWTLPKIGRFNTLFTCVMDMVNSTRRSIEVGWLSAIDMRHPDVGQVVNDKLLWIHQAVDLRFDVETAKNARFCFGSERKVDFAKPNVLLIEDYDKNHDRFVAAGGKCVLLDSEDGNYNVAQAVKEIAKHLHL